MKKGTKSKVLTITTERAKKTKLQQEKKTEAAFKSKTTNPVKKTSKGKLGTFKNYISVL